MTRILAIGCTAALAVLFLYACNDKLDVQQEYDFSLSCWHLQSAIRKDESVEMRLTLNRSGNFRDTRYYIGYIQMEGKGEVYDKNGTRLVNRELHELEARRYGLSSWILSIRSERSISLSKITRRKRNKDGCNDVNKAGKKPALFF